MEIGKQVVETDNNPSFGQEKCEYNILRFVPTSWTIEETGQRIAKEAIKYVGLPYAMHNTRVAKVHGVIQGSASCYGLVMLACRDAGLFPPNFPINLPEYQFGPLAKALRLFLHYNFERLDEKEFSSGQRKFAEGDILLFRFRDVEPLLNDSHHVAFYVGTNEDDEEIMIHALDYNEDGTGSVIIQRITPLELYRLDEVWRIK